MPVRIPPLAITLLALIGVILQGPVLCALSCLDGGHAHNSSAGMHVHAVAPASIVQSAPLNLSFGESDEPDQVAMDLFASTDCYGLGHQGSQLAKVSLPDTGTNDALFDRDDAGRPVDRFAHLHVEPPAASFGFTADPLERPPTA